MRAIVKNKNFLEFHMDKSNPYKLDVNTGKWYGLRGSEIENAPHGVRALVIENQDSDNNIVRLLYFENYYNGNSIATTCKDYRGYFQILDKLTSLGYRITRNDCTGSNFTYVNENMKAFAQYLKEVNVENAGLEHFRRTGARKIFLTKHEAYLKKNPQITEEMIDFVFDSKRCFPEEEIETVFYYLFKNGLYNFFRLSNNEYKLREFFQGYFDMLKVLDQKAEKEPFLQEYVNVKRAYDAKKYEVENEALYRNLRRHEKAFTFTDGKYITVIPENVEDFAREGKLQHNCVNSYVRDVVNGRTNVVFVREVENPTKPLVTAEINNIGGLGQFLLSHNQRPREDSDLVAFREAWREHIRENWE